MTTDILQQDIQQLLVFFAQSQYRAKETTAAGNEILQRCEALMRLDYSVVEISNSNGDLSAHYPVKLLIPEPDVKKTCPFKTNESETYGEGNPGDDTNNPRNGEATPGNPDQVIVDGKVDATRLRNLIVGARLARCRARFPLPVMMYNGKYICRSATLSGGPEIYGRSGYEYLAYAVEATLPEPEDEFYKEQKKSTSSESESDDWLLFGQLRRKDIRLLKALNVGTIIDFMVENKKVKYWLKVSSSEKVDKQNRYNFFELLVLPYPGCEFFQEFNKNNSNGEGLVFDWNQAYVDAEIRVPENNLTSQLDIHWADYKEWDLLQITQSYIRLLVKYLQESSSGILVHCISGWDRTPLFVSLLRMSLWADGVVHQSLDAFQMLYFTIAYDWLLFGHDLPDRMAKGEIIFFFCFYILKYLLDEEYSILPHRFRSQHSSGSSSIAVLRTDSDCMIDGLLLDGESRGSSISLNSVTSYTSGRSSMYDTRTCVSSGVGLTNAGPSSSIAIASRNGNATIGSGGASGCNGDDSVNSLNGNNGFSAHSLGSSSSIGCLSQDSSNHNNQWSSQPKRTSPVTVPTANGRRQRQESSSSTLAESWQLISDTGSYRSDSSKQHDGSNPGSSNSAFTTPNANVHQPSQESSYTLIDGEYRPRRVDLYARRRERLEQLRTMFYNCYYSTIAFNMKSAPVLGLLGKFADKVGLLNQVAQ